jgi:hypothetical protein
LMNYTLASSVYNRWGLLRGFQNKYMTSQYIINSYMHIKADRIQ